MAMEGKPVIKEMNKPQLIPLVGLPPIVAVLSLGVAVMLGVLYSWLAGITVFLAVVLAGRWMNRTDLQFVPLFFLSLRTGTHYDPALLEDADEFPNAD